MDGKWGLAVIETKTPRDDDRRGAFDFGWVIFTNPARRRARSRVDEVCLVLWLAILTVTLLTTESCGITTVLPLTGAHEVYSPIFVLPLK